MAGTQPNDDRQAPAHSPISQVAVTMLRARMTSTFAATYLTLLSIIQGTTTALLFSKVDALIGRGDFHLPQLVLTIGLFWIIVLLWHQYQIGVILYEWVPQFFDAVVPFVLGACEFAAILGLQYGSLVTAVTFTVFFLLGLLGLEYQFFQVTRATTRPGIGSVVRGFRTWDLIVNGVSVLIFAVTAALLWRYPPPGGQSLWANAMVLVVALLHGTRQIAEWRLVQVRAHEPAA
jgi:hypothetical protein